MTVREELLGVVELVPRQRVVLSTRLDGVACTTVVLAHPVKLALDAAVREAMCGGGRLDGVPAPVVAALDGLRGGAPISAGVHRFALDGLVPLAGAFGNAYVTTPTGAGAGADATVLVPDETIFVPDQPPGPAPPPPLLTGRRVTSLAIGFAMAVALGYLVTRALVT